MKLLYVRLFCTWTQNEGSQSECIPLLIHLMHSELAQRCTTPLKDTLFPVIRTTEGGGGVLQISRESRPPTGNSVVYVTYKTANSMLK